MYLRTKKMYQPNAKRRVHLFTLRWLWLWLLTPLVAVGGYWVYENADLVGPPIRDAIADGVNSAGGSISTLMAPTPAPTTDPTERLAAADSLWAQGAIEQAIAEYGALLVNAPNDVRSHVRYSYGLIVERRPLEALAAAERAVNANPFASDAWAIHAWALGRSGQYARAITSGLQALSLDSDNASALAFMAEAYLDAGQSTLASDRIAQALTADPDNPEAHFVRGLWNVSANFDNDAARRDFETAHELAPNLPNIMVEMAWVDWGLGSYDLGLDMLEQVVEVNPNHLDALYALGYFQYQVYGDPNKASDYLSRCLLSDPDNVSCLNYRATVQLGTGDSEGAAVSYQAIIDSGAQEPVYYLRAGRTYANLGDCRRATPLLRVGRELESDQDEPDQDRIAAFEEFMIQCGSPAGATFADAPAPAVESTVVPEITPTAGSLLVPLGGG